MRLRRVAGLTALCALLATGCSDGGTTPDAFLEAAWPTYLARYVHPDGYVLDPRRDGGRVTSEGQGYALLRAVWERDEASFRRLAAWTREHLQRADGLHSWLWSPEDGGRVVDPNTATDGDMEIAWALLMAAQLFEDDDLGRRGAEIVRAVRVHAGIPLAEAGAEPGGGSGESGGPGSSDVAGWFPAAGDWAVGDRVINLSYFVPYAHPWFQDADPDGGWTEVTRVGYALLDRWLTDPEHRLPPAFLHLSDNGLPEPLGTDQELETEFSFDAIRLYWRIEADCRLHGTPAACDDPLGVRATLELLHDGTGVSSSYAMDGTRLTEAESTTFYAALLPAARRTAPELAAELLEPRLDGPSLDALLRSGDRYYDQNWVWFGLALDRGLIEDRTPRPPSG